MTEGQSGQDRGRAVVIGAGIVGLCCAAWLQRDGWRVTLLDPDPPGERCSFGNAGMRSDGGGLPIAMPGILWKVPGMLMDPLGPLAVRWTYLPRMLPWLLRFVASGTKENVERMALEFATLLGQARASYAPLIEEAGAADLIRERGWLEVYETEEAFARAKDWLIDLRRRSGGTVDIVGPEELRQIEPALAPIFVGATYKTDADHIVNPLKLSQAIAASIRARGGEIRRVPATGLDIGPDGVRAVLTEAGPVTADLAVVAAGAWSKRLAVQAGARVPLDTERGYHVMLPNPGVEMRVPVKSAEGGFFLTPMEEGLRIAGTDELAGLDAPPDWRRIDPMVTRARRMVPGLATDGGKPWMGHRPSLPDSKPVIDRAPGAKGVMLAFGHGHYGLTLAAVTGRMIADLAAGRDPVVDPAPFRAGRF